MSSAKCAQQESIDFRQCLGCSLSQWQYSHYCTSSKHQHTALRVAHHAGRATGNLAIIFFWRLPLRFQTFRYPNSSRKRQRHCPVSYLHSVNDLKRPAPLPNY